MDAHVIHILFVDDEPYVLDALRRVLHAERERWALHFSRSGEDALAQVAKRPMDVVVADAHMPGLDGIALLGRLRETHPTIVRIAMLGAADADSLPTIAEVAHQSIRKPCEPAELTALLVRALALRAASVDERVRELISRIGALPPVPRVHVELTRRLADPRSTIDEVEAVLHEDAGLVTAVMRLANSAYFGHSGQLVNLGSAIALLGTKTLRTLALSAEIHREFGIVPPATGVTLEALQAHALATGRIASALEPGASWREEAFVAGALHDTGLLVMAARLPDAMCEVELERRTTGEPREIVERRVLGAHHGEIGAHLFAFWGLPATLIEAARLHPQLAFGPTVPLNVVRAVAVASDIADGVVRAVRPARFADRFAADPRGPIWLDRAGALFEDLAA
jgi:HD-like signal output (HDOD) protein/CheY-like chemotaxis protein